MEKKALYNLSYGVFMLSTRSGEKVNGCITNTCMQVANNPIRIAISVLNSNYTCDLIKESGIFALSLLDVNCSFETIKHFGFQSGRDVDKMKKAEYMMDHIGEVYEGIISGVQEFGFFVELDNTVEGLVRVEDIKGDYFIYNPDLMALLGKRSKRKYAFGDKVVVKVVSADKDKSTIDFEIYEEGKNKKNKKNDTKK